MKNLPTQPTTSRLKPRHPRQSIQSVVMKDLVTKLRKHDFSFSADTHLICVQHILADTLDMFRAFHALGIPFNQIYVLGKEYSTVPRVSAQMRALKINLIPTSNSDLGEYYKNHNMNVTRLWQKVQAQITGQTDLSLLLISDGGELLTSVPKTLLKQHMVVGVEQTKSGLFHIQKQFLPIPVLSVASSATKLYLETPIYIDSVIKRVSQYTNFKQNSICGVVGLGAMGSALVRDLTRKGYQVYAFDQAVTSFAQDLHYMPAYSVTQLLTICDYVFGCTGRDIFEDVKFPFPHKPKLVLASVTSGDIEFLSLLKYLNKNGQYQQNHKRNVVTRTEFGQIKILRQGYPINFNNLTGSAPLQITQLITSALLSSSVQAFRLINKKPINHGGEIIKMNPVLQKYITKKWHEYIVQQYPEYLDLYHKGAWKKTTSASWIENNSGGTTELDLFFSRSF